MEASNVTINRKAVRKILVGGGLLWQGGDYEVLEYLESTGGQWIDTGVIFRYGYRYQTRHLWVNRCSSEDKILGGGDGSKGLAYNLAFPRIFTVLAIWVAGSNYQLNGAPARDQMYGLWYDSDVLLTSNGYAQMTDVISNDLYYAQINVPTYFYTGGNIWLFRDSYTTYANPSAARIAFCRAWDEAGESVRDFIPARRLADGVLGMYDTVTKQFFTNQGSGEFLAGPATGEYY